MNIGFSTGSLSKGDFKTALALLRNLPSEAIEISALRESELLALTSEIETVDIAKYSYRSIHAPSKIQQLSETEVVRLLKKFTDLHFYVIVHPDIIKDFRTWSQLGDCLCIENMDKRKPVGRTANDLESIFQRLPEAKLCVDLAHARQIDPTMIECAKIFRHFCHRLVQLHISDVTSESHHVPLNEGAILAYRKVAPLIPEHLPIIIESPVSPDCMEQEVENVRSIFYTNTMNTKHRNTFINSQFCYTSSVLS